jgi:hypothetical protein
MLYICDEVILGHRNNNCFERLRINHFLDLTVIYVCDRQ